MIHFDDNLEYLPPQAVFQQEIINCKHKIYKPSKLQILAWTSTCKSVSQNADSGPPRADRFMIFLCDKCIGAIGSTLASLTEA